MIAKTPGTELAKMAGLELRKAEINEQWAYMASLLSMLQKMGARVMRVPDEQFKWRADYLVQLRHEDVIPGTMPRPL